MVVFKLHGRSSLGSPKGFAVALAGSFLFLAGLVGLTMKRLRSRETEVISIDRSSCRTPVALCEGPLLGPTDPTVNIREVQQALTIRLTGVICQTRDENRL